MLASGLKEISCNFADLEKDKWIMQVIMIKLKQQSWSKSDKWHK